MKITANTKLSEILTKYPGVKGELTKISERFKLINSPIGKVMVKKATVKEMSGKAGMAIEDLVTALEELVKEQEYK